MSTGLLSTHMQYGTSQERLAAQIPTPPCVFWLETDTDDLYLWSEGEWYLISSPTGGGGGITQLTGPVTAGPGSGSQATTITPTGVTAGHYGDAYSIPALQIGADGRITAAATNPPAAAGTTGQVQICGSTGAVSSIMNGPAGQVLTSGGPNNNPTWTTLPAAGITQLTGDGTAGPGSGSQALTLAASGVTAGTYGDSAHVNQITVNAKGLVTAVTPVAITANVTGPASVTAGDLASYADATGKVIADAGIPSTQVARKDQSNTFTAGPQTVQYATPMFYLWDTSGAADAKVGRLYTSGGLMVMQTMNDALTTVMGQAYLSRAGTWQVNGAYVESNRSTPLGYWIDVAYDASAFFGESSMGWTVPAGAIYGNRYTLIGKTLIWTVYLGATTITGTGAAQLYIRPPVAARATTAGFVPSIRASQVTEGGVVVETLVGVHANGSALVLQKNSNANWIPGPLNSLLLTAFVELA